MHTKTTTRLRRVTLVTGCGLALALTGACSSGSSSDAGSGASASASSAGMPPSTGTSTTADDRATTTSAPSSPASGSSTAAPATSGAKSLLAAGKTALGKVPGGKVISIDSERGGTQWEVEVVTTDGVEHKVYVSRDGAKIVSGPRTDNTSTEDRAENLRDLKAAKLDYRAAARAVLAARGGTLSELNLDDHRGTIVWEADVEQSSTTRYEVAVDAGSGDVVTNHRSDADEED